MTNETNPQTTMSPAGTDAASGTPEHLRSREGDPRKVDDQQDARTSGSPDGDVAKDDPSRAPESGTP